MKDRITQITDVLAEDSCVVFAYLFGSMARREENALSDIDIAVYLREDCDPAQEKLNITGQLMDLLGTDRFDLVILNSAALPLAARIIRCHDVLVDKEPFLRHCFESLTLRKYFDFSVLEESILTRRFSLGR